MRAWVKSQRPHRGINLFYSVYSEHVLVVDSFFVYLFQRMNVGKLPQSLMANRCR